MKTNFVRINSIPTNVVSFCFLFGRFSLVRRRFKFHFTSSRCTGIFRLYGQSLSRLTGISVASTRIPVHRDVPVHRDDINRPLVWTIYTRCFVMLILLSVICLVFVVLRNRYVIKWEVLKLICTILKCSWNYLKLTWIIWNSFGNFRNWPELSGIHLEISEIDLKKVYNIVRTFTSVKVR